MKVIKWPLFAMLMAICLLLITACGPEDEPTAPEEAPTLALRIITDSTQSALEKEVHRRFEEAYPAFEIKRESWSQWPRQYMTSDKPPDLMAIGTGDWLFSTIRDGLVADITDVWEQAGLADSYPDNLRMLTERGGKQYFLPTGYNWFAFYYNRALFEQYNIQPPQTWDELLNVADQLVSLGEIPFAMPTRDTWTTSLWFDYLDLRLNGADFHRALINGEIEYTDDRVRNVFLTWQFLIDQDYFTDHTSVSSSLDTVGALIRGDRETPITRQKAAMALLGAGEVDDMPLVFQNELDFFAFPEVNPEIPRGEVLVAGGYVVPANAPHRLDAMSFLSFVTSAELQEVVGQYLGPEDSFIPANIAATGDLTDEVLQGKAIVDAAEGTSLPYFWASPSEMRTVMDSRIDKFLREVRKGELDLDSILRDLEEARQKAAGQGAFDD